MTLYVELLVNRASSRRIVRVEVRNGAYHLPFSALEGVSLPLEGAGEDLVDLSKLAGVTAEYESAAQQLWVTVPSTWLPLQDVRADARERTVAAVSPGMLLNYDIYASAPSGDAGQISIWTEGRYFDSWGTLVSTGAYRSAFGENAHRGQSQRGRYLRYDTNITHVDLETVTSFTVGDGITGALEWTTPIRLGGVTVARNFASRPDIVTYPLPQFAGQAAVPTAVDLLINGNKVVTSEVGAGPFVLNQQPFVNGAGEAVLVTTDALGRKVETSVPFYVASELLRPGLWDYSLSAGAIRRGYGVRSFAYGPFAMSGSARLGATPFMTLEGHAELAGELKVGGVGMGLKLGTGGVVNTSVAVSGLHGDAGVQYSVGYAYFSQRFSLAARHVERTRGFRDLATYEQKMSALSSLMRSNTQVNASVNLGPSIGTIGAAYYAMATSERRGSRGANLSYMRGVGGIGTLFASVNKAFGQRGVAAQMQVILPFGRRSNASAGLARGRDGTWNARARYSHSAATDGGLGWNVGYSAGNSSDVHGDMTWRNRLFEAQAGVSHSGGDGDVIPWVGLRGSVVAMGGAILPTTRINDAFALIDTQGHAGVPIRYENQLVGKTNGRGYLLVPWAPSFYRAKYEIDALGLGDDVRADVIEKRVAVRNRAGARITFPVQHISAATVLLVDEAGKPIPVGSEAYHPESETTVPVGWNGETYLEGLGPNNAIHVTLPDGQSCSASFAVSSDAGPFRRIGPLICSHHDRGAQ